MRISDWNVRLADWAQLVIGRPFAWGQTDCVLLSLEAVDTITGTDLSAGLAAKYRGRYDDMRSALRLQRDHDIDLARELLAAGAVEVRRNYEQAGDIVCAPWEGFVCGHVCFGSRVLSAHPDTGVATARAADCVALDGARILRIS